MIDWPLLLVIFMAGGLFGSITTTWRSAMAAQKPHHLVCDTCGASWDETAACEQCGNYTLVRRPNLQ